MENLNRIFLTLLNTVGVFFFLTIPHILKMTFNIGFAYPMFLILICSFLSIVGANLLTRWELKKIDERNKNKINKQ